MSSTLARVEWTGSKLVKGDVAAAVREVKAEPGGDLLMAGSGQLFNALMQENLIDIYRFMVHPIVLGKGRRLFSESVNERILDLMHSRVFSSGIVVLEYQPARRA